MKQGFILLSAVMLLLCGLTTYTAAGPDYGALMIATLISQAIAIPLFLWLLSREGFPQVQTLIKLGAASSAGLALASLAAYLDILGIF